MSDKTPQTYGRTERRRIEFGAAICGFAGIAFSAICTVAAFAADTGTAIPITGITVDAQRQLVIKFDNHTGGFPAVPHLLDLPGPNHRVVVDFAGATIEKGNVMSVEELSEAVMKVLPACKGVRYSNLTNAPKPTARIVVDLPEALHADPRVVKLEEGMVTIDLGDAVASAQSAADPVAATPAADAAAPAAANSVEAAAATDTTADAATAPTAPAAAAAPETQEAAAPAAAPPVASATDDMASAPKTKSPNGSWDWSGNGAAATAPDAAPSAAAPGAVEQPAKAAAADAVDGVSTGAAPTQIAAQPGSSAELRPAIAASAQAPAAGSAESSDQPLSSSPPAAAAAPGTPEVSRSGAQAALKLYNAAVKAHLSGKLTEAITNYKGAIAANPQFAEAHSNLGLIYNQQHDYPGALAEFRKALAINPKDAITYNGIGAALRAQRDLPGAIKNWQTAVSLDPHLATAQYNLGTAYELQKDYDKALASYQDAVKNDYRLGEAYYRMGLILSRKHELEDAATQFKEALKVSGDAEYANDARAKLAALTKTTANTSTPK